MRRVLVTGAAGFLGRHIVNHLLQEGSIHVVASDKHASPLSHPNLTPLICDLDDPALHHAARTSDGVIHLAATLGGAAEADPVAAFTTNVTASLALMAACRPATRLVFASSLAVLGETAAERAPVMTYGAHKAMVEIALETATRRGELDGVALRPGGIVARRDVSPALKSAFLSQLFWAVAEGVDLTVPVTGRARSWIASGPCVAAQFCHALTATLGPARSVTLPMVDVRFDNLVEALRTAHPDSPAKITFAPQPDSMALFGRAQPLCFKPALALGFAPDTTVSALVQAAFQTGDIR